MDKLNELEAHFVKQRLNYLRNKDMKAHGGGGTSGRADVYGGADFCGQVGGPMCLMCLPPDRRADVVTTSSASRAPNFDVLCALGAPRARNFDVFILC